MTRGACYLFVTVIANTILGVPYFKNSITGPKTLPIPINYYCNQSANLQALSLLSVEVPKSL